MIIDIIWHKLQHISNTKINQTWFLLTQITFIEWVSTVSSEFKNFTVIRFLTKFRGREDVCLQADVRRASSWAITLLKEPQPFKNINRFKYPKNCKDVSELCLKEEGRATLLLADGQSAASRPSVRLLSSSPSPHLTVQSNICLLSYVCESHTKKPKFYTAPKETLVGRTWGPHWRQSLGCEALQRFSGTSACYDCIGCWSWHTWLKRKTHGPCLLSLLIRMDSIHLMDLFLCSTCIWTHLREDRSDLEQTNLKPLRGGKKP